MRTARLLTIVSRGCESQGSVSLGGCASRGVYTPGPRGTPTHPPWTEGMTRRHACENITFPQLLFRVVFFLIVYK